MFHALLICSFTDTNKPSRWSTIGGHVCQRIWNMAAATAVKPLALYIKRSGTSQHPSKRTQSCAVARTLNGCNHRLRMDRFCFLTQICCYIHPGTNVDTTNAVEKNSIIEFLSTMMYSFGISTHSIFLGYTPQCPIQLRLEGCQTLTPNLCVAVDVCADPIFKERLRGEAWNATHPDN